MICCIGSVHSQSCFRDSDCDGGICCLRGNYSVNWLGNWSVNWFNRTCSPRGASCPCLIHSDCRSGERCNWLRSELRGVCKKRNVPYFPTYKRYTFNIPTSNLLDVPTFDVPFDPYPDCVLDSDCYGSRICKDGQCRHHSSRGLFSGIKLMIIALLPAAAIIATIISCVIYYTCKRTRKPPNLPSRNLNINAPPTGVETSRRNDHEMQAGNECWNVVINLRASDQSESTNSTVVVVEDETPLPPGAPPPYSSLKFEARQGSESLSDQSPPSYDEAVRTLTST